VQVLWEGDPESEYRGLVVQRHQQRGPADKYDQERKDKASFSFGFVYGGVDAYQ